MKICSYCDSINDDSAKVCTACGASAFKNKCNNCGTIFESAFCPTCGTKAGTQEKVCPQCGERYFSPACPRCGHNTVVNKTQRRVEEKPKKIIIEHVTRREEKPKNRVAFGKVLLWILFLPIMALIAVWRSKQIPVKWKLLITAVIPLLCLLNYPTTSAGEKASTVSQVSVSHYTAKTVRTAAPTKEAQPTVKVTATPLIETTAAPTKQPRNGFREGVTKHTIGSYSISVPNYFGNPTKESSGTNLFFIAPDEEAVLILDFSKNNVTKQDFDARIERGFLNLFQNAELMSSDETKVAELPGRILNATGYYSNVNMLARAAIALDENQKGILSIILMQREDGQHDYYSDFIYVVRSVRITQETVTKQTATSKPNNSKTVSKELKEVMDGYEAFVDSYCTFMKKYADSDDVSSMMMEYLNMLSKYYEWESKVDDIDEDTLSEADLLYYNEVMLRCASKLLQASNY